MFGTHRTGSTLVTLMLYESMMHVYPGGNLNEVFSDQTPLKTDPLDQKLQYVLDNPSCFKLLEYQIKAVNQTLEIDLQAVLQTKYDILYVERRDFVAQALSYQFLLRCMDKNISAEHIDRFVYVDHDTEHLLASVERYHEIKKLRAGITIYYEDLVNSGNLGRYLNRQLGLPVPLHRKKSQRFQYGQSANYVQKPQGTYKDFVENPEDMEKHFGSLQQRIQRLGS